MLGDPDLNLGNQDEWIPLISKCLPCKTLPKHLDCPQDARCLQHVASRFEEFTLHSTLLQVSCVAGSRRKHFLKVRAEDCRCICSATMTVRMWTTTNEEVTVPPGEGDRKNCAFYPKSTLYNRLVSISDYAAPSLISGTSAPLPALEVHTSDGPGKFAAMEEPITDLTGYAPALSQANSVTLPLITSTDGVSVTAVELTSGSDTVSASSVEDKTNHTGHSNQHSDTRKTTPDSPATEANTERETLSYYGVGMRPLETIRLEQARHQDSVDNVVGQDSPEVSCVTEPPRVARRSPFLSMQVPCRDVKFFGREEFLIPLEDITTSVSVPSSGGSGRLDSGAIIVLYGEPGVGKSAIALELTYRTQATFDYVIWLRANTYLHLAQSFHEAAASLGLTQDRRDHNHASSRQKLIAWLSTTSSKWLLVFDDADTVQVLPHFMPNPSRGTIIVTSRQPLRAGLNDDEDDCFHLFHVGPFVVEEATAFVRSLAPDAVDAANPAADIATLMTIANSCGCLPLTLRTVGTMINRRSSIKKQEIMVTLEEHAIRVLPSQPSSPLIYAELSSASLALLNVIAFLDPYCLDDAVLLGAQRYKQVPLSTFPMNDDDYFDAKNELIAHALLAVGAGSGTINIHRVTSRSLRAKLDPNKFREGFQSACRLLEARWPSRRKMKNIVLGNWPEFDALHSHVHKLFSIFVEHVRKTQGKVEQELSNDSYLQSLLLSTW